MSFPEFKRFFRVLKSPALVHVPLVVDFVRDFEEAYNVKYSRLLELLQKKAEIITDLNSRDELSERQLRYKNTIEAEVESVEGYSIVTFELIEKQNELIMILLDKIEEKERIESDLRQMVKEQAQTVAESAEETNQLLKIWQSQNRKK